MTDEQTLIQFIRNHANAHYESGWSTIVECWEDGDILEALSENDFDLPKTMQSIKSYLEVIDDRDSDAHNSVF